jgi:ribose 1,5-bisphosphate isomerase
MSHPRVSSEAELAPLLRALARLGRDRVRGARALSRSALRAIERALRSQAQRDRRLSVQHLRAISSALRAAQPAMGSFQQWADDLALLGTSLTTRDRGRALQRWVNQELLRLDRELPRIAATVRARLPPRARLLTLSRSATTLSALARLPSPHRPREVVVLESRPGGEGRLFATDLKRVGIPSRWVRDARGPLELPRADALVIGADTIYLDGSVLHKIGTRDLARRAHRSGVPVNVIAGRSKAFFRMPPGRAPNPLFDLTPGRWVTEFWTDGGAISGSHWHERQFRARRPTARDGGVGGGHRGGRT